MGAPLSDWPRPSRPSRRSLDGGRNGPAPPSAATAAEAQRRTAEVRLFCFAMQSATFRIAVWTPPAENSRRPPLPDAGRLPSDRPLEGRGAAPSDMGAITASRCARFRERGSQSYASAGRIELGIGRHPPGQAARARLPEDHPMPRRRRSSLKSPSLGDNVSTSMPALGRAQSKS